MSEELDAILRRLAVIEARLGIDPDAEGLMNVKRVCNELAVVTSPENVRALLAKYQPGVSHYEVHTRNVPVPERPAFIEEARTLIEAAKDKG